MRRATRWCATSLAVALAAQAAWGQVGPDDAEYARAAELRRGRRFDEALGIYRRLAERTHHPRAVAQVGFTEAQMGEWLRAEQHLTEAMRDPSDAWIAGNRTLIDRALTEVRGHLSDLTVACATEGATLRINDRDEGTLPRAAPVRVARGTVVVDVVSPAHVPYREVLSVNSPEARVSVTLVPHRPEGAPTATPTDGATTPARLPGIPTGAETRPDLLRAPAAAPQAPRAERTAETAPPPTPSPPPSPPRGGGAMRTLAWISATGAVGFVIMGVVGQVVGGAAADRYNSDDCLPAQGTRDDVCAAERGTAEAMGPLRALGFAGGGVLAVVSTVLFVTSAPRARQEAVRCGGGPGTLGVSCALRF